MTNQEGGNLFTIDHLKRRNVNLSQIVLILWAGLPFYSQKFLSLNASAAQYCNQPKQENYHNKRNCFLTSLLALSGQQTLKQKQKKFQPPNHLPLSYKFSHATKNRKSRKKTTP